MLPQENGTGVTSGRIDDAFCSRIRSSHRTVLHGVVGRGGRTRGGCYLRGSVHSIAYASERGRGGRESGSVSVWTGGVMFARRWLACGSRRWARDSRLAALGARAGGGARVRLVARPARTDARWASVPGARRPRLPPLTSGAETGGDPEGSCAAAPSRAWSHQRRLRSPAHCVGTHRRRLSVRAEDSVARRFARGRRGGGAGAREARAGGSTQRRARTAH
jgi:hypothetical protein